MQVLLIGVGVLLALDLGPLASLQTGWQFLLYLLLQFVVLPLWVLKVTYAIIGGGAERRRMRLTWSAVGVGAYAFLARELYRTLLTQPIFIRPQIAAVLSLMPVLLLSPDSEPAAAPEREGQPEGTDRVVWGLSLGNGAVGLAVVAALSWVVYSGMAPADTYREDVKGYLATVVKPAVDTLRVANSRIEGAKGRLEAGTMGANEHAALCRDLAGKCRYVRTAVEKYEGKTATTRALNQDLRRVLGEEVRLLEDVVRGLEERDRKKLDQVPERAEALVRSAECLDAAIAGVKKSIGE